MVGPDYQRPPAAVPATFKELPGWKLATQSDAECWTIRCGDRKALEITQNQFAAGFAAQSDVITAGSALEAAEAAAINVGVARAQYEHTTVLIGKPPAALQSGDERRAADARHTRRGAVRPARTPAGRGLRRAFDEGRECADQRGGDRILSDNGPLGTVRLRGKPAELANLRILAKQDAVDTTTVAGAKQAVQITLNEYEAGTQAYTTVITAQNTPLSAQETEVNVQETRLTEAVALIQALGGGWSVSDLPDTDWLQRRNPLLP